MLGQRLQVRRKGGDGRAQVVGDVGYQFAAGLEQGFNLFLLGGQGLQRVGQLLRHEVECQANLADLVRRGILYAQAKVTAGHLLRRIFQGLQPAPQRSRDDGARKTGNQEGHGQGRQPEKRRGCHKAHKTDHRRNRARRFQPQGGVHLDDDHAGGRAIRAGDGCRAEQQAAITLCQPATELVGVRLAGSSQGDRFFQGCTVLRGGNGFPPRHHHLPVPVQHCHRRQPFDRLIARFEVEPGNVHHVLHVAGQDNLGLEHLYHGGDRILVAIVYQATDSVGESQGQPSGISFDGRRAPHGESQQDGQGQLYDQ